MKKRHAYICDMNRMNNIWMMFKAGRVPRLAPVYICYLRSTVLKTLSPHSQYPKTCIVFRNLHVSLQKSRSDTKGMQTEN